MVGKPEAIHLAELSRTLTRAGGILPSREGASNPPFGPPRRSSATGQLALMPLHILDRIALDPTRCVRRLLDQGAGRATPAGHRRNRDHGESSRSHRQRLPDHAVLF
jgi:hypothetical protein